MQTDDEPAEFTAPRRQPSRARRLLLVRTRRPLVPVIVGGVVLGIVVLVVAVLAVSRRDAVEVLVAPTDPPTADIRAELAITSIDPAAGELGVRLVPAEGEADLVEAGLVTEGFRLVVNDVGGQTTYPFPEGDPVRSVDFSVALTGGSPYRYPFDTYEAGIIVFAAEDADATDGRPLSVEMTADSTLLAYELDARLDDCLGTACLTIDVARPASTIGYSLWFIALVWGLAVAGLAILLVTVRRGIEIPLWAYGYLVGVLFALPPLRNSLPDNPPAGGFVDYVAFYWAIAVVGLSLLMLVALWVRETRPPTPGGAVDDEDEDPSEATT